MANKTNQKLLITITNTEGARLGYGPDAPFAPIETRVEYEKGAIYGLENIRTYFVTEQEFVHFVQMIITHSQGTYKTFSWVHR